MIKRLSQLFSLCAIMVMTNCAIANPYDYNIEQYDIELNFKNNNEVIVKENIDASFRAKQNSILRKLPVRDTALNKKRTVYNVETNDMHIISSEGSNNLIKIVPLLKNAGSEMEYSLNYNLAYDSNIIQQDFSYNIVDGSWDECIERLSFKIKFPKDLRNKNIEFISSTMGIINSDFLEYTVNGSTIEGYYNKTILPHEVLTLHITPNKKNWFTSKRNTLILNDVAEENITLYENDEMIIRLNANKTTGFVWQLTVDPEDTDVISLSNENYIEDPAIGNVCGSGGISEFIVKALKKGEATINGVYIRPWMKYEDTSGHSVKYKIEVK